MQCANCAAELIPGKRFCHVCGAPARGKCPACGATIEPGFRFCPDCGASLSASPAAPVAATGAPNGDAGSRLARLASSMPVDLAAKIRASTEAIGGERKLVTVLFCDLVGSTAIAERLDPEEYRDLLEIYLAAGMREVYRFEGIVTQLAGDGFMALFGAPVAHEDAPERAVRAALAIQQALHAAGSPAPSGSCELRVRIGIHSGPVVVGAVGSDLKMEYTAIGDTTNLAARLQSLAEPGMVLLSEATYRLVRGVAKVRSRGAVAVKGKKDAVTAYVLEDVAAASPMSITAAHGLTPLVGRAEELAQLGACYERTVRAFTQIVAIVGEAGSGKSRLIYEFKRSLAGEEVTVLEGRCSSLRKALPYGPFVAMLAPFFGVSPDELPECVCDKVARKLKELNHDPAASPYLCRLFAISSADLEKLPPEEVKQETFKAVSAFLQRASETSPVLVIIEDLQWIDELSRELLAVATNRMRGSRIMVVASHRSDYHHPWRTNAALTWLHLDRLSAEQTGHIVRAVCGGSLPAELEQRILTKAEGNPFFAEEISRALIEQGYIVAADGGVQVTQEVEEIAIPDTVQEVLGARLDRLSAAAKRVVQVAAVLGRQFHGTRLAQLLAAEGIDVEAALAELEGRGVIHREAVLARDEFRFGESLTHEVAFETLLLKERRRLHERIGFLIEAAPADPSSDRVALLAHHFALSDNHQKAVEALLEAGRQAESLPSYRAAKDLYRRAWERAEAAPAAPENGSERFRRWALEASLAMCRVAVLYGTSSDPGVENAAGRARQLAAELSDDESLASVLTYHGMVKTGKREEFSQGLPLVEEALAIARRAGSEFALISIARALAWIYLLDGRLHMAQDTIAGVVQQLETLGQGERLSDTYFGARWMESTIRYFNDDIAGALQRATETHELALRTANRTMESSAASLIAQVHFVRAEYAEARTWTDRALAVAEVIGSSAAIHRAAAVAAAARTALGERTAVARYADLLEEGVAGGGNTLLVIDLVVDSFLAVGDLARAERVGRKGYEGAAGRLREMLCSVALGDVEQSLGRGHWDEAARWYARALTLARELASRSTLVAVLLGSAKLAVARGDGQAARPLLDEARALCGAMGLEHYQQRAVKLESLLRDEGTAGRP